MRAFIVLCAIALASADVSHLSGYNYGSGGGNGAVSGGCGGSGGGSGCGGGLFGGDDAGVASSNLSPSISGGDSGSHQGGGGGFDKEFFTYTADDNDFHDAQGSDEIANSLKQNLRVIFIKGPDNRALENAAAALAKHASDQRTAIYVLNKQADIGDLANKLNQINNQNHNKPEVHFVKYRTPEDAHNAQSQIQNQYAGLGGSSKSHDGGVANVLDFASKGSSSNIHSDHSGGSGHGGYPHSGPSNTYVPPANTYVPPAPVPSHSYIPPAAPHNSYIPPSIFRRLRL